MKHFIHGALAALSALCLLSLAACSGGTNYVGGSGSSSSSGESEGSSSETTYTITISDSITNGTVTASKTKAEAGEEITLTVTPSDGYAPDTLTVKDAGGADVTVTANKFTMPAKNVTVSAVFKVATVTYSVTVDGAITGGTVASDKTTGISAGTTVTLTITPDGGKVLDALTVKDASNNAVTTTAVAAGTTYTFAMPEGNVSVTATFKAAKYFITGGAITGGTVEALHKTGISSGETVTLTVTAESENVLDTLTVMDASNNTVATTKVTAGTTYTFTMPSSNATVTATFVNPYSTGLVGDIVLSDGKYITATNYEKYSEQLTQTAVAVIFDVSGSSKKGVGLVQGTGLAWAKYTSSSDKADGYSNSIAGLVCTPSASGAGKAGDTTVTFTGTTDGSGSLTTLKNDASITDYNATNYPAWDFVENYATTAGLTGTYTSGWYMPSIAELCKLYQGVTNGNVNNALNKITGATQLSTSSAYWSSSQYASNSHSAWNVYFGSGHLDSISKLATNRVCAVRAF